MEAIEALQEVLVQDDARGAVVVPLVGDPDVVVELHVFGQCLGFGRQRRIPSSDFGAVHGFVGPVGALAPGRGGVVEVVHFLNHG